MDLKDKAVIVSCGVDDWYPNGVRRLERSLIHHGYAGELTMYINQYPPDSPTHKENPYAFKIAAIEAEIAKGRTHILWLDASFWAIRNPNSIFDIINDNGVFAFRTGYNCAQTCSDAALEWAGISRDEAEELPEQASGMVGLNTRNPDGKRVYQLWKEGCMAGLFINNRQHDKNDSADPRFLHARQDQSIFSLAVHKCGLRFNYVDYVAYYKSGYDSERCMFFINGL